MSLFSFLQLAAAGVLTGRSEPKSEILARGGRLDVGLRNRGFPNLATVVNTRGPVLSIGDLVSTQPNEGEFCLFCLVGSRRDQPTRVG